MVKLHKKEKGRQGWNDTVKAIAKSTGAEFKGASPAPKRRDTRKRTAKAKKARWVDDAGVDARDLHAWARLDSFVDKDYFGKAAAQADA